nr:putative reverse transcriptase domain-containing protein [Tanacetum cinerariifolium]
MQVTRDRQKSYANKRRKPLEFRIGDKVMLKVPTWKDEFQLDDIQVDDKMHFIEEPLEVTDREIKQLKKTVYRSSKCYGIQGEVLNLHGNMKTNCDVNTNGSRQRLCYLRKTFDESTGLSDMVLEQLVRHLAPIDLELHLSRWWNSGWGSSSSITSGILLSTILLVMVVHILVLVIGIVVVTPSIIISPSLVVFVVIVVIRVVVVVVAVMVIVMYQNSSCSNSLIH